MAKLGVNGIGNLVALALGLPSIPIARTTMISIHVKTDADHCDTMLLPLGKGQQLSPSGAVLQDQAHVADFLSSKDHQGEFAKTRTLYGDKLRAVFVGSGEESKLTLQKLRT
ncbi:MAG: hypothetical protein R8M45_00855, partial [Ghiorsea sp.]